MRRAELVEHADDDLAQLVLALGVARRRSRRSAGPGPARSRPNPAPRTPARAPGRPRGRSCVARPSAAKEPATLLSASSAPSRSPAAARRRAYGTAASARPGSSSSARRRLASPPSATSASASEGTMPVEEALDLRRRQRADELVDDLAVLERLHGRDRLDAEGLREARVGVGVDLDERDLAVALVDGLLDHGPERAAGTAPLGPEVDDHGVLVGALDDVALEGLFGGFDGHTARIEPMDLRIDADGVTLSGEEDGRGSRRSCCCTG